MKIAILTSSPNMDGLTAACGEAAARGAGSAGAETTGIDLNALDIGKCRACGNGWGPCRTEHACQTEDDFQAAQSAVASADACVFVTPVYWGEMSESAKAFFDRLRRCEASKGTQSDGGSILTGKPVACVAAAGGSGNGTISCLESMERLCKHVGADIFDLITITRKSRSYKLEAIESCGREIASLPPRGQGA